jgi:two-component system sensor histidine kinase RpfC
VEVAKAEAPGALQVVLLSCDGDLAQSLGQALAGTAMTLETTASADVAGHLLSAQAAAPDRGLLLVDSSLPGWDGAALALVRDTRARFAAALLVDDHAGGLLPRDLQSTFVAGLDRRLNRDSLTAVAHLAASRPHAAPTIADAIAQGDSRSLSILVAEDNSVNQKVVTKILERAGHAVRIAANGEEAVDMLLAERFDLVLMDVNMPVMSGIEATKLYRFAALGRERVPIVALTADATPDGRDRCLEAGMDACLSKPIEVAELFRVIQELTAESQDQEAAPASDRVTDIAAHPKFRAETRAVLDSRTVGELEALGGRDFVLELAREFLREGERILAEIQAAVADGDVAAFHDRLHALRSGAANLGALSLYEICLSLRAVSDADFRANGREQLSRVEAEFARAEEALADYSDSNPDTMDRKHASVTRLPR